MKKLIVTAVASATAAFALNASAMNEGEILIWIGGDKAYTGLQAVGDRFAAETGVSVRVETPDDVQARFRQEAALGRGPDVMIWAHDWLGELVEGGLVQPISPSDDVKSRFDDFTWEANTYQGELYGYPLAVEAIGLIYNKALVPTPPKTFEEVFALDRQLKQNDRSALLWAYNDAFFAFPVLSSAGGYVFGVDADGNANPRDVGLANEGGVKGAEMIRRLITEGVMPAGSGYGEMMSAFTGGDVAMIINGAWEWGASRQAGIDIGLAPVPAVDGVNPGRSFVGVLSANVNASTPNADLVELFMTDYLLTAEGMRLMDTADPSQSLGVSAHLEYVAQQINESDDGELIGATYAIAEAGINMPNIPEMAAFWSNMNSALEALSSGRQAPAEAVSNAVERMLR
ncbi:MAG: maltose/maltodextrin ABC transporter substrate-binding protein MalE [Natronospirillum sp.]